MNLGPGCGWQKLDQHMLGRNYPPRLARPQIALWDVVLFVCKVDLSTNIFVAGIYFQGCPQLVVVVVTSRRQQQMHSNKFSFRHPSSQKKMRFSLKHRNGSLNGILLAPMILLGDTWGIAEEQVCERCYFDGGQTPSRQIALYKKVFAECRGLCPGQVLGVGHHLIDYQRT